MQTRDVIIRSPWWMRLYVVAFMVVAFAIVVGEHFAAASLRPKSVVGAIVVLGLGAVLAHRMLRLGIHTQGDVMTVRGVMSTRVLRRSEIEAFRIGDPSPGLPMVKVVYVLLADGGVLPLEFTVSLARKPAGSGRLDDLLRQLMAWHAGGLPSGPADA